MAPVGGHLEDHFPLGGTSCQVAMLVGDSVGRVRQSGIWACQTAGDSPFTWHPARPSIGRSTSFASGRVSRSGVLIGACPGSVGAGGIGLSHGTWSLGRWVCTFLFPIFA